MVGSFDFLTNPKLYFGAGRFAGLPKVIGEIGNSVLIVTGTSSLEASGRWDALTKQLDKEEIDYFRFQVSGEPTSELVDLAVSDFRQKHVHAVVAIGGGSVIDTGKAISAMLPYNESVEHFLEGIGKKKHDGSKAPFIAVPTTAGTGSEATKNAVLSKAGPDGYKKSLRHDNLIPDAALIDPELTLDCPPEVTAASGMDALTQLLEGYVSSGASVLTDTLAVNGLEAAADNLIKVSTGGGHDISARSAMAYVAYLSGVVLCNAGLGAVHGFASSIGGLYEIPHGVICGTLLGAVTEATLSVLVKDHSEKSKAALQKYSRAGYILSGRQGNSVDEGCGLLMDKINQWTLDLGLPLLREFGVKPQSAEKIVSLTENKSNAAKLDGETLMKVLLKRI